MGHGKRRERNNKEVVMKRDQDQKEEENEALLDVPETQKLRSLIRIRWNIGEVMGCVDLCLMTSRDES